MRGCCFLLAFFLFTLSLTAQTYQGPADGSVSSGITLNTNDFSNSREVNSSPGIFNIFEYEGDPELLNWGGNIKPKYFSLIDRNGSSTDSTILFTDFVGIPQTNSIPPDDYIAAGPNNLMMAVNSKFRIYDKSGNVLKTINADQWFGNLIPGVGTFDPKVIYDPIDERWVMVWLATEMIQGTNYYLLSVSDDSDPTGVWFNWALPSDVNGNTASGNWADYEGVGFDENAVYLTSNQWSFSGFYDYVKLRIIDKSKIYINSNPSMVTWKDIWSITLPGSSNSAYNLRPSRMYTGSANYYLVYLPSNSGNFCSVFKLINSISNPALTAANIQITAYSKSA